MTREEIEELAKKYGFDDLRQAVLFGEDIERTTRHRYFHVISIANNAASSHSITPRELEMFFWKRENDRP